MLIQGFALGQHVYADGAQISLNSGAIKVDGTAVNNLLYVDFNTPILENTYQYSNGSIVYNWSTDVYIRMSSSTNTGYYNYIASLYINADFPSNTTVYQWSVDNVESNENTDATVKSLAFSSGNHYVRTAFSILGNNQYLYKNDWTQIVKYTIHTTTNSSDRPTFSFTSYGNSYINLYTNKSMEQIIIDAIEKSDTAEDISLLLTQAQNINANLTTIISAFNLANSHLKYIQEYAYEIWDILARKFPSEAKDNMDNAESSLSDINNDIKEYTPATVDANDVNTKANNAFQQMNIEGDSNNLFFYLNWSSILPILTLIFTLAILSYVLYGGK